MLTESERSTALRTSLLIFGFNSCLGFNMLITWHSIIMIKCLVINLFVQKHELSSFSAGCKSSHFQQSYRVKYTLWWVNFVFKRRRRFGWSFMFNNELTKTTKNVCPLHYLTKQEVKTLINDKTYNIPFLLVNIFLYQKLCLTYEMGLQGVPKILWFLIFFIGSGSLFNFKAELCMLPFGSGSLSDSMRFHVSADNCGGFDSLKNVWIRFKYQSN